MATKVIMPQLGESIVEGTVLQWLKAEGDTIDEFEALLEIETDKVVTEIPSPASGTLLKVYVEVGQTVGVGTILAMIGEPGEEIPEGAEVLEVQQVAMEAASDLPATPVARVEVGKSNALGFISPVVARIASEHSVDLAQVRGTGRGGRITKKDILSHIETRGEAVSSATAPWEEPAFGELFRPTEEVFGQTKSATPDTDAPSTMTPGTVHPLGHLRRSIAEHMVRSSHVSPHVTTVMEVDLSQVVAHRKSNKETFARDGVNLTFTAYIVVAVAEALKTLPIVNSSWGDKGIILHPDVNVGVAVSLGERGLIVPVVKNADQKSLRGIASEVNDLAQRARADQLQPDEVQQGTFTITNHGVTGSLFATPIINQPQCAILGVGAIQKRAVVVENRSPSGEISDLLAIRPMMYLTLTFDHRILDGAVGDQFLSIVVSKLENWQ
jgi:pyruvate/2-oxoglutarate dehydrogenase complex dihydrolipoamide acyltransferase (E2) component